jgi:hypothetical protein
MEGAEAKVALLPCCSVLNCARWSRDEFAKQFGHVGARNVSIPYAGCVPPLSVVSHVIVSSAFGMDDTATTMGEFLHEMRALHEAADTELRPRNYIFESITAKSPVFADIITPGG